MGRELRHNDCQGKCDWHRGTDVIDGLAVFECRGCGSEWTTAQAWTPKNADGEIAEDVAAARAQ